MSTQAWHSWICPPTEDYGYDSTPKNALTFATMGVDGVHYAILQINGSVEDSSPVIQVSPIDFDNVYIVLADSFLSYLADACDADIETMESLFEEERKGKNKLVGFLKSHFDHSRLLKQGRLKRLRRYLKFIEPKQASQPPLTAGKK